MYMAGAVNRIPIIKTMIPSPAIRPTTNRKAKMRNTVFAYKFAAGLQCLPGLEVEKPNQGIGPGV
jgi:hypothetical protein